MKSPFPGMDPYLEARWSDVHSKLIVFLGEAIQAMLPSDLRARSEERLLLETIARDPIANYRSERGISAFPATVTRVLDRRCVGYDRAVPY